MADKEFLTKRRFDLVTAIASKARQDAFAAYQKDGQQKYRRVDAQINSEVIVGHLTGAQPIAVYTVVGDQTSVAVLDFDDHDKSLDWNDLVSAAIPIVEALKLKAFKPLCCRSGGGAGLHIWLIWKDPQPAKLVKQFLRDLIEEQGFKHGGGGVQAAEIEVFPKNDRVKEGSYGNAVALPYSRASVPLDEALQPLDWPGFIPPDLEDLMCPNVAAVFKPPKTSPAVSRVLRQNKTTYGLGGDALPGDQEEAASALLHVPSDDYDTWIKVGLALKHSFGREGFEIWDRWSSKSKKYPGSDVVRETWDGLEPTGAVTLGTIFHLAQQGGWNGPTDPIIREMNTQFGILTHGASTRIILKVPKQSGQGPISWLSKTSFEDRLAGDRISVESYDGSLRKVSKSKHWLNHSRAAHYYEIIFDPGLPPGHNGNRWNMWRGFAVEPKPGKWDRLQDHIFTNICTGNTEHYEWLLNWMALGVQNPGEVVGTAPVLAGLPGTGKGVLANAYGRLWGEHYVSVTKDDHISGRFNNHLMGKRFVYIDEGMFGGDRRNAGVVKTMITEPRLMFEAKGLDPFFIENHMIFMVTSNERSIVAADIGDRRWQVLSVSDKHREDRLYFAAIVAQLASGGAEAMLYDLLTRDVSAGPDPHKTIRTPELFDQIIQAQGPIEKYLYQVLDEGFLPQPEAPGNGAGMTTIGAMLDQMKRTQPRADYVQLPLFGRTLTNLFPGVKKTSSGKVIVGRDANGRLRTERSMRYDFPPLSECRRLFALFVGQEVPWSNDLEEWLGAENTTPDKSDDYPF